MIHSSYLLIVFGFCLCHEQLQGWELVMHHVKGPDPPPTEASGNGLS